jgi:hypothetical protein
MRDIGANEHTLAAALFSDRDVLTADFLGTNCDACASRIRLYCAVIPPGIHPPGVAAMPALRLWFSSLIPALSET